MNRTTNHCTDLFELAAEFMTRFAKPLPNPCLILNRMVYCLCHANKSTQVYRNEFRLIFPIIPEYTYTYTHIHLPLDFSLPKAVTFHSRQLGANFTRRSRSETINFTRHLSGWRRLKWFKVLRPRLYFIGNRNEMRSVRRFILLWRSRLNCSREMCKINQTTFSN